MQPRSIRERTRNRARGSRWAPIWLLGLAGLPLGCGGPEVGELALSAVSLTLSAVSSAPELANVVEPAGGLVVTRAWVSASSLSLLPCRSNTADLTLSPRGYELLSEPRPGEYVSTAVTTLCGVRVDIDPLAQNAAEGVPEGAAIFVEGQQADGSPFALHSPLSSQLVLEAEPSVSFGEQPLILGFDVAVWLAAIDFARPDAGEQLTLQLATSVAIYLDANDDGNLDEDERTQVAWVR